VFGSAGAITEGAGAWIPICCIKAVVTGAVFPAAPNALIRSVKPLPNRLLPLEPVGVPSRLLPLLLELAALDVEAACPVDVLACRVVVAGGASHA
jgi:hypothetical protein